MHVFVYDLAVFAVVGQQTSYRLHLLTTHFLDVKLRVSIMNRQSFDSLKQERKFLVFASFGFSDIARILCSRFGVLILAVVDFEWTFFASFDVFRDSQSRPGVPIRRSASRSFHSCRFWSCMCLPQLCEKFPGAVTEAGCGPLDLLGSETPPSSTLFPQPYCFRSNCCSRQLFGVRNFRIRNTTCSRGRA